VDDVRRTRARQEKRKKKINKDVCAGISTHQVAAAAANAS
jgi:hypothetical protein